MGATSTNIPLTAIQLGEATAEEARAALVPLISAAGDFDLKLAYTCVRAWTWKTLDSRRHDDGDMRAWFHLIRAIEANLREGHPLYAARFETLGDLVYESIVNRSVEST